MQIFFSTIYPKINIYPKTNDPGSKAWLSRFIGNSSNWNNHTSHTIVLRRSLEQILKYRLRLSVSGRSEAIRPTVVVKKPFPCMHCERSYKNKSSLNRHVQYECGKEKQFSCPICQRRMIQKSSLHKHMLAVHGIWVGKNCSVFFSR